MSKALATISSTAALTAIQNGMQLCQNILQYKHATNQLKLECEAMHRQANHLMQQEQYQHEQEMKKLKIIAKSFNCVLKDSGDKCHDILILIKKYNDNIQEQLMIIKSPNINASMREQSMMVLNMLQSNHKLLLESYVKCSNTPMDAFVQLTDSLRGGPRTFTDVS